MENFFEILVFGEMINGNKCFKRLENPPHFSIQTKIPPDNRWDFLLNCLNYSFGNLITEINNPPQMMMSEIALMKIALVDILFFSLCLCEIFPR